MLLAEGTIPLREIESALARRTLARFAARSLKLLDTVWTSEKEFVAIHIRAVEIGVAAAAAERAVQ